MSRPAGNPAKIVAAATGHAGGKRIDGPLLGTTMLSEQVVGFLMGELVSARLGPGDRINEAELARRLGISRNPIREAVKRLEERGLLVSVPRRGTFVRTFSRADLDEIYSFRVMLECFALRQALEHIGEAEVAELAAIVTEMEAAAHADDEAHLISLDLAFHARICRLSRNGQTVRAFTAIQGEVQMLIALVNYGFGSLADAAADHWPIVRALQGNDPARAEAALAEHIRDAWSRIARNYPPEEPRPETRQSQTADMGK